MLRILAAETLAYLIEVRFSIIVLILPMFTRGKIQYYSTYSTDVWIWFFYLINGRYVIIQWWITKTCINVNSSFLLSLFFYKREGGWGG